MKQLHPTAQMLLNQFQEDHFLSLRKKIAWEKHAITLFKIILFVAFLCIELFFFVDYKAGIISMLQLVVYALIALVCAIALFAYLQARSAPQKLLRGCVERSYTRLLHMQEITEGGIENMSGRVQELPRGGIDLFCDYLTVQFETSDRVSGQPLIDTVSTIR